ncbi:WD40-repeat-containing domain protein [Lyophyllum atratum]|nr:WD40-repeat-containing domain protein [Lyophyllum atratum]
MTEFVAPVDKLLAQEKSTETSTSVKVERTKPKPATTCGISLLDRMSFDASPPPPAAAASSPSTKPTPTRPPSIPQNAVASSSKVVLEKAIPTGPTHLLRLFSTRALEKSPATSSGLGLQSQAQGVTKRSSPPPDPKSLAYISSGPTSNPLNIRPSAASALRGTAKVPPTAPKTLTQTPVTAKKRVVVGAGWPFVKATNGAGPVATPATPTPPLSAPPPPPPPPPATQPADLSNIIAYPSPSPPPSIPPLPATVPQNKWKRVNGDPPSTPLPIDLWPSVPSTPCLPNVDGKQNKKQTPGKGHQTPILEKTQMTSLKDRISQPSASAPVTPAASTLPVKANGRDLRSRISDAPSLLKLQTTSSVDGRRELAEPMTSSTSPFVSRSPAVATSIPAPTTPTSSSLTHPLPPKPVLSLASSGSRGIKRERPKSPDHVPESASRKKRKFRWPTVDSNYSAKLLGEGQLGIRCIAFNSNGSFFALSCADRTIRIWNNGNRTEIARLSHNSPVVAVSWMDGDTGVVSLGEDGLVSKWTRSGVNHWNWAKVLDAGKNDRRNEDDQVCLAYVRDRVAVSFPRTGVKVWMWLKGTWQSQRSILRQNVTVIRFVDDGAALLGGTRDGVLWHCEVPNGTLRAYAFLKSKIQSLDLTPSGAHVLVGVGPHARLVGVRQPDNKGSVEQIYSCKETEARPSGGFGAVFATEGQAVLFGSVDGCALVWDRKKGTIVYGLEHDEDDVIQAAASFDGPTNREGYLITGTKAGHLAWWSQPVAAKPHAGETHKRAKVEP